MVKTPGEHLMPIRSFRIRLLERLLESADGAGELALALLMTAGVLHCGGAAQTGTGEGTVDAAADRTAGWGEGGPMVEAATFPDTGTVVEAGADALVIVEAPPPPQDGGADDASDAADERHIFVEAPN
jgi:hypothetical protein